MEPYRQSFGKKGEEKASLLLESRGFTVIEKNYYAGRIGEIDLIAEKEGLLVFVEVKTRNSEAYGGPLYSINRKKLSSLRKSAEYFLLKNPVYNKESYTFRFDLITVMGDDVQWVEDIVR